MEEKSVHDILTFLHRSKGLEANKRYGVSLRGEHNTVAEHSWRLALMTLVIGEVCNVRVDLQKAISLALIHDLAEAKTGDVDAFTQITEQRDPAEKHMRETTAMRSIVKNISFGSWILEMWEGYEAQESTEAKFVRALDKIEGFLHIAEDGVHVYVPKEFHATYADEAVAAFDEATHHFPELRDLLDAVKRDLKQQFEERGVKWVE